MGVVKDFPQPFEDRVVHIKLPLPDGGLSDFNLTVLPDCLVLAPESEKRISFETAMAIAKKFRADNSDSPVYLEFQGVRCPVLSRSYQEMIEEAQSLAYGLG